MQALALKRADQVGRRTDWNNGATELGKHHGTLRLSLEILSRQLNQLAGKVFDSLHQICRNASKFVFCQGPIHADGIAFPDHIRQNLPSAAAIPATTARMVRRKLSKQFLIQFFVLLDGGACI